MILGIIVLILGLGALATLFAHVNFIWKLFSLQPDVWRLYKSTAYSWLDYPARHQKLRLNVYPLITNARVIRAMKLETILLRIFAGIALISVGAFCLWRFGIK
jgi:hypothetical protein